MEGGDDLFECGQAAIARSCCELEGAGLFDGAVALAAGLAELPAEPLVFACGLDEGPHEDGWGEGGGGLGVLSGGCRIDLEEVALGGVELLEGSLEALDIPADLADEALGAGVGAGGLRPESRGEVVGEAGPRPICPGSTAFGVAGEGDGGGGGVGGLGRGR